MMRREVIQVAKKTTTCPKGGPGKGGRGACGNTPKRDGSGGGRGNRGKGGGRRK